MKPLIDARPHWLRTAGLGLHGNALMGAVAVALLMTALMLVLLPGS